MLLGITVLQYATLGKTQQSVLQLPRTYLTLNQVLCFLSWIWEHLDGSWFRCQSVGGSWCWTSMCLQPIWICENVPLHVFHNALHPHRMHFWCYRKIEHAHSLHFPSPREPSLPSAFSLRELIGLNVAEWSSVSPPPLSSLARRGHASTKELNFLSPLLLFEGLVRDR